MKSRGVPVDLSRLKTYSIAARGHKVALSGLAGLPPRGASFAAWLAALPDFLGAKALRAAAAAIVAARRQRRPVVFAMGAHVIKVGCAPVVIDLIERGVITAVAMNGATAIHDVEMATLGETSEEVAETIRDGRFGMVRETADFFAEAALRGASGVGLGAACGRLLLERRARHARVSVLAAASRCGVTVSVHVAIGTDTIHMHPQVDGAAIGAASASDFRLICGQVTGLGAARRGGAGGVWCNVGSAVILPEVFLKAVAVARNLGHNLDAMTTVNLDMLRHYRPHQNVLTRPVSRGRGIEVVGHHEISLPLLRQAVIEQLPARRESRPRGER